MNTKNGFAICNILGVDIAVTNMQDTIAYIEQNMDKLRGQYICVSNVHTTVMAHDDEEYRMIQNSAFIALPDGKPLSIVSKKRGFANLFGFPLLFYSDNL